MTLKNNATTSFSIGSSPAVELNPELHSGHFMQIGSCYEFIVMLHVGFQEITANYFFIIQINF